jgi:hypothetical protein
MRIVYITYIMDMTYIIDQTEILVVKHFTDIMEIASITVTDHHRCHGHY